jgi:glycosyltransferase involved in cell wall biosynthesis
MLGNSPEPGRRWPIDGAPPIIARLGLEPCRQIPACPRDTGTLTNQTVRFSIVTPSFRNSEWLKLCIASVADQGVALEHIVQDAGSDDGTLDWLNRDKRVMAFVEKDTGMYDAMNRGLGRARGEILACLNCDEQYLPGTLAAVSDFFEHHPEVEVAFGDFVAINREGGYLFHRKVLTPLKYHTWVAHLQTFTCATFFRRKLIHEDGLLFDPRLRDVGDGEWMLRLLRRRTRMAALRRFTSAFTMTGANMSAGENARREARELARSAPAWARRLRWVFILHHRLRRVAGGIYHQKPFSYAVYTRASPGKRIVHEITRPASRWRS